jgi:4-aminobutyrate aminotransferase/(S)-3-amino-2-methylpropionate transaminase
MTTKPLPQSRRIVTQVPGPKSRVLLARRNGAVPDTVYRTVPTFVSRAQGAIVEDVDGNRFIDLASGIAVLNVGNSNPRVIEAMVRQASRYIHTCFHVSMYEPYVALAERLNTLTPGDFDKRTLLVNSGSEAVEFAAKIARRFTGRDAIVVFDHSFHGRTNLASKMSSSIVDTEEEGSPSGVVYRLPLAYPYRCPMGSSPEECGTACVEYAIDQLAGRIGPERIACVVIEPILGFGGGIVPPIEFVAGIADFCSQNDILLVADEVQTGFGRTGRWFGSEHFGITPDLIVMAKALGGGMPVAAVTGRAEIMDGARVGVLGSTQGGNPVACAAALAALDEIEEHQLIEHADLLGSSMRHALTKSAAESSLIGDIRGLGAMMAVELVRDKDNKTPAPSETDRVVQRCFQEGVIVIKAGSHGNVLRLLPPLTVGEALIEDALAVITQALVDENER